MLIDLRGRVVVVTGAARGIGLGIAQRFARSGAQVALFDTDPEALAQAVTGDLGDAHGRLCDVRDPEAVDAEIQWVVGSLGSVDVLVNNAGILRDRVLWKLTDADWRDVLDVHLTGSFNCTRAVIPTMRARGYGRIVNVTSYSGLHGNVGQANYAAAKAGIIGFTRTAAKELARFGITVNAISPNSWTRMVDSIPDDQREQLLGLIPMARFGTTEDAAVAVLFLASEQAGYITGAVLPVDGGLSI